MCQYEKDIIPYDKKKIRFSLDQSVSRAASVF